MLASEWWACVYVWGFVNIKYLTTLMRMGLDEADEHIAMEATCMECCTCGDLRDTSSGGTVVNG